jgi:hypothetical protein
MVLSLSTRVRGGLSVHSLSSHSSSGGYNCIHAAYGTVTLYESSWWSVGTQLEWELTVLSTIWWWPTWRPKHVVVNRNVFHHLIANTLSLVVFIAISLPYFNAIGLTPSGSNTVHIYTQTIHRTTQSTQTKHRTTQLTESLRTPFLLRALFSLIDSFTLWR